MKSFINTLTLSVYCFCSSFAQKSYQVQYKFNIHYDLLGLYREINNEGVIVNDRDTLTSEREKQYRRRLFIENVKMIYDRKASVGICTPLGLQISSITLPAQSNKIPEDVIESTFQSRNQAQYLIDYKKGLYTMLSKKNGIADTLYWLLDTANMHIIPTNERQMIAGRKCIKYIPADTAYSGIYFWVDPELPSYVHPAAWFGIGAEGGIAAVTFKNTELTITLEEISETARTIPFISNPRAKIKEQFNPTANIIDKEINDPVEKY